MSDAGGGFKLPLLPYINGNTYQGTTITAATNGYARYSNLSSAQNIWSSTPSSGDKGNALYPPPTAAIITAATKDVRWKIGADPTSSEGHLLAAGKDMVLDNAADVLRDLRFIETSATAELTVQYFYQF